MKHGVWIPNEVLQDQRLTPIEKIVYSMIISLDQGENGCWASNQYLAVGCNCSVTTVSTTISKLIKLGYVHREKFDGRKRILKSSLTNFERLPATSVKAASAKTETDNIYDFKTSKYLHSTQRKNSGKTHFGGMERPAISEKALMKELSGRNGNLI